MHQVYEFSVTPMGAPRMTRQDKWAGRDVVVRYKAFGLQLRSQASRQGFKLTDIVHFKFYLPMPASWSEKKKLRMALKPHQVKPDNDNLIKAFMDGLYYKTDMNDATIWDIRAQKYWNYTGKIVVIVQEGGEKIK